MKINYDKVADAMYFSLKEGKVFRSERMSDQLVVDMTESGEVVGMELLNASSKQGQELEKYLRNGIPVNISSATPVLA